MEAIQAKLKYYNAQADKELAKYPQIIKLEQQTNIPKTYMAAGVVGFVFFLIFFDIWGQLLSNLIGWLYPAYTSFKAIESEGKADDTQWLTYWTVFGFVNIVEFFSDTILYWLPLYYLFKTIFFLWLFLPPFKGAQLIYSKFLRPVLLTYQGDVDASLSKLKSKVGEATKEAVNAAVGAASETINKTE
ncbi:TB2/DP1, HVA22 family-domain-containing protein [Glomus cerebriforme]|uniref:Protein YOP1 n=1 Tax=Glomus cerebriforme TaxID=658196 RepID=A0A397T2A4_9GLOM|nr:TB2/DP1, HVA22 family-domain-containing protein [Glomus cerebriforme]